MSNRRQFTRIPEATPEVVHRTPTRSRNTKTRTSGATTADRTRSARIRQGNGRFGTPEDIPADEFIVVLPDSQQNNPVFQEPVRRRITFGGTPVGDNPSETPDMRLRRTGFAIRTGGRPNDLEVPASDSSRDQGRSSRPSRCQFIPIPIPIPTSIASIIDMTKWAIAITPSRVEFFYWCSLLVIKCLCFLTNVLFWIFACMALKTLPTWTGLTALITAFWTIRPWWLGGPGFSAFGEIWAQFFTEAELLNSHYLQLVLHETGEIGANVLNTITIPLLVGNPIFWAVAVLIMFIFHGTLSFIYGCLIESDRMRVRTWRN